MKSMSDGKRVRRMSDLIKREDALKELRLDHNDVIYIDKTECARRIKAIPSADRPQGEWIVLGGTDFSGISYCAKCSNCKDVYDGIRLSNYSYCPTCGARLKGASNGEDIQSTDE